MQAYFGQVGRCFTLVVVGPSLSLLPVLAWMVLIRFRCHGDCYAATVYCLLHHRLALQFTDLNVKNNFALIYELLDGMSTRPPQSPAVSFPTPLCSPPTRRDPGLRLPAKHRPGCPQALHHTTRPQHHSCTWRHVLSLVILCHSSLSHYIPHGLEFPPVS
jgi:hypothetical protein